MHTACEWWTRECASLAPSACRVSSPNHTTTATTTTKLISGRLLVLNTPHAAVQHSTTALSYPTTFSNQKSRTPRSHLPNGLGLP